MARVLVINAGSSSLKLSLLGEDSDEPLAERELDSDGTTIDHDWLTEALAAGLGAADIVAHRIVHGGSRFRQAVLIDHEVRAALDELTALAPQHQPKSLAALDAVSEQLPTLPAVACFDTAFHATLPDAAATFALPREWRERWQLRRYGFHGLSHAYIASHVAATLGDGLRIVSCHLGAGASLCAIADGCSVDTTMGFTPLDGLVMATRCGSIDPGLLLWLLERTGLTEQQLASVLEHESGLLGLAGTADMREILAARERGDACAKLSIAVYQHRLRAGIGAMAAALGAVNVLVFTGGVGEHAVEIRDEAVAALGFLAGAPQVLTVRAREDLEIARQARLLLSEHSHHSARP